MIRDCRAAAAYHLGGGSTRKPAPNMSPRSSAANIQAKRDDVGTFPTLRRASPELELIALRDQVIVLRRGYTLKTPCAKKMSEIGGFLLRYETNSNW
jgi:hypothetical protein